jgi:hypothetical protein
MDAEQRAAAATRQARTLTGLLAVLVVVVVVTSPLMMGVWRFGPEPKALPPPVTLKKLVTEADFEQSVQNDVDSGAVGTEWRTARSDHRTLVLAILACEGRLGDFSSMPPEMFSALLLDLTPNGSHQLAGGWAYSPESHAGSQDGTGAAKSAQPLLLPGAAELLSLSDAIARARLSVAGSVKNVQSDASRFWISVLLVSGFASLFVALQSQFKAPGGETPAPSQRLGSPAAPGKPPPTENTEDYKRWEEAEKKYLDFGHDAQVADQKRRVWRLQWWGSHTISVLAVTFSIAATTLAALKQYYDPGGALSQNENTLLALDNLHQQLISQIECHNPGWPDARIDFASADDRKGFLEEFKRLEGRIVSPYPATGGVAK